MDRILSTNKFSGAAKVTSTLFEIRLRSLLARDKKANDEYGQWLRLKLASKGPFFTKTGQFLSSRNDILPQSLTKHLRQLQDNASPITFDVVKREVCREIGVGSLEKVFSKFSEKPLASASIGQVHKAKLRKSGREVVVKVQKPNVKETFDQDIAAFRLLLSMGDAVQMRGISDAHAVLNDIELLLEDETDFLKEKQNMIAFSKSCAHFHWLKSPRPVERLCTSKVIVMDYEPYDFKSTSVPKDYVRRKMTAHRIVELLVWSLTEAGMMHCDLHPGNMCFREDGKVVLYDYGMMTHITPAMKDSMKKMIICFYNKDAAAFTDILVSENMIRVKSGHKKEECYEFFQNVMESMATTLDTATMQKKMGTKEPPFIVSSQIFSLFRTMLLVESACKSFDPNFNFISYMRPFMMGVPLMMPNGLN